MDCRLPGSSVHAISQARILEWVAISFSRRSFWPRDWTSVSCIFLHWQADFYCWSTEEDYWLSYPKSLLSSLVFQFLLLPQSTALVNIPSILYRKIIRVPGTESHCSSGIFTTPYFGTSLAPEAGPVNSPPNCQPFSCLLLAVRAVSTVTETLVIHLNSFLAARTG